MAEYEERTEKATPRRRQKAREEGNIVRSRDLSAIAAVGGVLLLTYLAGDYFSGYLKRVVGRLLSLQYGREPFSVMRSAALDAMVVLTPFLGVSMLFSVGAALGQGGIVMKPVGFNLDSVNPLNGFRRIFSLRGLMESLKSIVKFGIGGYLLYAVIKSDLAVLPVLMEKGVTDLAAAWCNLVLKATTYGFLCFLFVSTLDFLLQKWQFERSIRMTKEEIRQEFKESEGDPRVKTRIRTIQRELAMRRMMHEVPKATVVVTNPTHLAVALKYVDKETAAPLVVAKGAGLVAERIRETARKHGVPVVEDKPLARLLFKLDIGAIIPHDLYRAVAKILAYIYRARERR